MVAGEPNEQTTVPEDGGASPAPPSRPIEGGGDTIRQLVEEDGSANKRKKSGAGLKGLTAIALVIAVVAVGGAGYLWYELEDLKTSTASYDQRLARQVGDLEDEVGGTSGFGSRLSDRVDDLEDEVGGTSSLGSRLSDRVDDLEDDVSDLESDISRLDRDDFDIIRRIDVLTECVNTYMKTVGDAGGGRYQYYFC